MTPRIVVVTARSEEGWPWPQISRSVPVYQNINIKSQHHKITRCVHTGMTFRLFPRIPKRGQTYTTAQYSVPAHLSINPVTINTPVSIAIRSSSSLVPSPLRPSTPASPLGNSKLLSTHARPAPSGVSPRSTACLKYSRNCSRPLGSRAPIAHPKVAVRGYPPR